LVLRPATGRCSTEGLVACAAALRTTEAVAVGRSTRLVGLRRSLANRCPWPRGCPRRAHPSNGVLVRFPHRGWYSGVVSDGEEDAGLPEGGRGGDNTAGQQLDDRDVVAVVGVLRNKVSARIEDFVNGAFTRALGLGKADKIDDPM